MVGYYTKEEVAELIRYAAERHVTIIPEIEMPAIPKRCWPSTRISPA